MEALFKRVLLILIVVVACSVSLAQEEIKVTGRVELSASDGRRPTDSSGAVVWLTPVGAALQTEPAPRQQTRQLLQKFKTFSPHLLVVPVGSSVDFPNQDPFFHNVFSLFDGRRFDLGLYESGSSRTVLFNRAGVSYIFCNIHPEMSAVVVVLKTRYYAISDRSGSIVIPLVPAGRYEMQVWHERVLPEGLSAQTRNILISASASSLGVLHLMAQRNLLQTHKNKYGQDYDDSRSGNPAYRRN
jgi:plastocyanin